MQNNTALIAALLTLIIGGGIGYALGAQRPVVGEHMMPSGMMMHDGDMGMEGAMEGMMDGLQGKEGDAFDRAFLSGMIVHHEGAVAMAKAALVSASHAEIKQMAQAIISAQTAEIKQMQEWQRTWYGE